MLSKVLNRPTFFNLLYKSWSVISGPVTMLVVSSFITAEEQGYYYTFFSLIALQSFVELGFYNVIIHFASHEWSGLRLDSRGEIQGDQGSLSRLVSLGRFTMRWYAIASVVFVAVVGPVGQYFLSHNANAGIVWQSPWWSLVVVMGLQLTLLPVFSLLEGCNQLEPVYRFRFINGILFSAVLWTSFSMKAGLWSAALAYGASWVGQMVFLTTKYRGFFRPFFSGFKTHVEIPWKTEILPMQWKLAVLGVVNYFATSIFTPVIFRYHGAVAAGQMGMTWQALNAIQSLSSSWIQTNIPMFGMLIAKRDFPALDKLFKHVLALTLIVTALGGSSLVFLVWGLNFIQHPLAQRLLPLTPTILFCSALLFMQVIYAESSYLRAFRREPWLVLGLISSLAIGGVVWFLGKTYGAVGAGAGYLAVAALFIAPAGTIMWARYRRLWQKEGMR